MSGGQNTALVSSLVQILATYGPETYLAVVNLLHHPDPTKEDFLAVLDSIGREDYDAMLAARRAARGLSPVQHSVPPAIPIATPPTIAGAVYDSWITRPAPSDEALIKSGASLGDLVFISAGYWNLAHHGAAAPVPSTAPDGPIETVHAIV